MTNEELAIRIQNGDNSAQSELWDNVKLLIKKLMLPYLSHCHRRSIEESDLFQVGYFAMMDAVKYYKLDKDIKFTSYLGYNCQNRANEILGYKKKNISPDHFSVENLIGDDFAIIDTLEDEQATEDFIQAEKAIYNNELKVTLDECFEQMPSDEVTALQEYFIKGNNYREIAECHETKVGEVRVSISKGLRKLRHPKLSGKLKPFLYYDIASSIAYKYSGLSQYKRTGISSVERAVERVNR